MNKDQTPARSIVIGTAGHIDHGKTALVKALTGIDTTHLPAEKRRGITIDLGFASREVQTADGSPVLLSFVDVPGHSSFIRNMLAGAGGIDFVLLVISAQEGVKPQTREHLAICDLLGVRHGLPVLSKADTVDPAKLAAVREQVSVLLKDSYIDAEPLPVSARTGAGIPELLHRLAMLSAEISPRDATGLVRLPVDRSFSLHGFGTVVTGTLTSGTIETEQRLSIEPGSMPVRVRTIQTHGRNYGIGVAGSRIALNLAGVDHSSIPRGSTIVVPQTLPAINVIDTELTVLPDAPALKHRSSVSFHAYASDCSATVLLYETHSLAPGSTGTARLRLKSPIVLIPGDRFIVRRPSPAGTIGGGVILDTHPLQRLLKKERLRWLHSLRGPAPSPEEVLVLRAGRRNFAGLDRATALRETGWPLARIDGIADSCVREKKLIQTSSGRLISLSAYNSAVEQVKAVLADFHRSSPSAAGIKKADLQAALGLPSDLFAQALTDLALQQAIKMQSDLISEAAFQRQLSSSDEQALARVAGVYLKAGLEIPRLSDVTGALQLPEKELRRLLAILSGQSTLARIGIDMYVHARHLTSLREKLSALRGRSLDVALFKQLTNLSRKHAIPWLEYLDRERITRRSGDTRHVL